MIYLFERLLAKRQVCRIGIRMKISGARPAKRALAGWVCRGRKRVRVPVAIMARDHWSICLPPKALILNQASSDW